MLLATRYSLLATRYSLLATRYCYLLLATRYLLLATHYLLHSLLTVYRAPPTMCHLLLRCDVAVQGAAAALVLAIVSIWCPTPAATL